MRWVNHIAQSAAICAVFNPAAVPAAILGSTAPDWLEWVGRTLGKHVKHRHVTHYLSSWLLLVVFALAVIDWRGLLFWFAIGGAIHWFQDALTITGAPIGWWSQRRTTLFGGRMRTGSVGEYVITGCVCCLCAVVIFVMRPAAGAFIPFFYDWFGYYHAGLIDAAELKANRLNWF